MTSELIRKITNKSKRILFEAHKKYRSHGEATLPYDEIIVSSEKFPGTIFLVHKNMIFNRGSISDSSYDVYSFNKEGEYIKKENNTELGRDFFTKMKVVKDI